MAFQKPKGTMDWLPGTVEKWQFVEATARELCRRFNYSEIRTPIFEQTELFQRGVGETTDIVEKEMYTFADKGGRSMTLRPEGTAGVVRAFAENKLHAAAELTKLYYIGPMFRYERAQAGRYRQFHQFGVEVFGSEDPSIDAEVIALGYQFYAMLGIRGVTVDVNSVGTPDIRAAFRGRLTQFLEPLRGELCADCLSRLERNPLRVLDCKRDQHLFADAPSIIDSLDEQCTAHFEAVCRYLTEMGIPFRLNPRLVRGLDYYTHTAFEYKAQGIGAIDTIGGGGRFNGLVSQIGGPDLPGIGLGLGLERTLLILEDQQLPAPGVPPLDVYLIALGDAAAQALPKLLQQLRSAGFRADKDYQQRKMKAQLKAADRLGARFAAIIGDDELAEGVIALKNLTDGQQATVRLDSLVGELERRL